jgi:hypothetical protein
VTRGTSRWTERWAASVRRCAGLPLCCASARLYDGLPQADNSLQPVTSHGDLGSILVITDELGGFDYEEATRTLSWPYQWT